MKTSRTFLALAVLLAACSSDPDPSPADMVSGTDAGADVGADTRSASDSGADQSAETDAEPDAAPSFCERADCQAETPVCSELLQRCVECASSNDCGTAPNLTCDDVAGDDEPTFTCVECVDDSVCGGGTCDLDTHTCVP